MTEPTPTTHKLIDELEDLRELLDDQIPVLCELADEDNTQLQGPLIPTLGPAEQIPTLGPTDQVDGPEVLKSASTGQTAPRSDLAETDNPFLPSDKLKELAVERATIEKLFHPEADESHPKQKLDAKPEPEPRLPIQAQLEQTLKAEIPALTQKITAELTEELMAELQQTLKQRLERRLSEEVEKRLGEMMDELQQPQR